MNPFRSRPALMLFSVAALGLAACQSSPSRPASSTGALVQFHADSNVRNPAANDAYPGVRRIALRALDNRTRPDAVVQVNDRVALPPGERTLLFAAEASTGRVTLSELKLQVEAGVDYVVFPVMAADGAVLAEVKRGPYGETLGRSAPWTPPAAEARKE